MPDKYAAFSSSPLTIDMCLDIINSEVSDYKQDLIIDDEDPKISSLFRSVNYCLFGNFGSRTRGECSLWYVKANYNQCSPETVARRFSCPLNLPKNKFKGEGNLVKSITSSIQLEAAAPLLGRLIVYYLSHDNINRYTYDCIAGGTPNRVDTASFITDCINGKIKFYDMNVGQARLSYHNNFITLRLNEFTDI